MNILDRNVEQGLIYSTGNPGTSPLPSESAHYEEGTHISFSEAHEHLLGFELDSDVAHLDIAIATLRKLLHDAKTEDISDHFHLVTALAKGLIRRYEQRCSADDIDSAICILRDGILHAEGLGLRLLLAEGLLLRYLVRGGSAFLDEALLISRHESQVCTPMSPEYCATLHNLAYVQYFLYQETRSLEDLEVCLQHAQEGLRCCTSQSAHEPRAFLILGNCLAAKYMCTKVESYSEASETAFISAQGLHPVNHPDRYATLSDYGELLVVRYFSRGTFSCIDKAQELVTEALNICPAKHYSRGRLLRLLAVCFEKQWHFTSDPRYLERAAEQAREALALYPSGRPCRVGYLSSLAVVLKLQYDEHGEKNMNYLEEAIQLTKELLHASYEGHLAHRIALSNLGNALTQRYHALGYVDDIEEAVTCYRACLAQSVNDDIYRSHTTVALAQSLWLRFSRLNSGNDIEEAVTMLRELLPDLDHNSIKRATALGTLGEALFTRFRKSGVSRDLDDALEYMKECLIILQLSTARNRRDILSLLAEGYGARYQHFKDERDAHTSLSFYDKALSEYPIDDPARALCLLNRAELQICLAELSISPTLHTVSDALGDQSAGAWRLFEPLPRILEEVAKKGMPYFLDNPDVAGQVLDVLSTAITLLTEVTFSGLNISSRLVSLARQDIVFTSAVAYGKASGKVKQALEILEQSRSLFWEQVLHLRTPMDGLPENLRSNILSVVHELEHNAYTVVKASPPSTQLPSQVAVLELSDQQRQHASRLRHLVRDVRALPGLERFMLYAEFPTLREASKNGPVILLVDCKLSCEAFILRQAGDLLCIPLSSVNSEWLVNLNKSWDDAVINTRGYFGDTQDTDSRLSLNRKRKTGHYPSKYTQEHVLGELWRHIVQPVISALNLKKAAGKERTRLWWCCNGSFAFLPVHAAENGEEGCSSYVVSSYIPTLGSLLRARNDFVPLRRSDVKVLLSAVSLPNLPTTVEEISVISDIVPKQSHIPLPETEDSRHKLFTGGVTIDTVIQNAPNANIMHLACHGIQDTDNPLESGFILADGNLTIARLMSVPLPRAFFAFMSACETAKGDVKYANQSIHLGAAMLFAGFKSVVGTMWRMDDSDGPVVAKTVYERLFEGDSEELDPDTIPYALDEAAQILRQRGYPPGRWATYIHLGM